MDNHQGIAIVKRAEGQGRGCVRSALRAFQPAAGETQQPGPLLDGNGKGGEKISRGVIEPLCVVDPQQRWLRNHRPEQRGYRLLETGLAKLLRQSGNFRRLRNIDSEGGTEQ